MTPETLSALQSDIHLWQRIRLTSNPKTLEHKLCDLHIISNCRDCPIAIATGASFCRKTPVGQISVFEFYSAMEVYADRQANFLKTLLPKDA